MATELGADVIHSAGYTGPLFGGPGRVTSIHDMNYMRHPEDLSLAERMVYRAMIPLVAVRSHRVLTLTQASRSDILRWTNAAPASIVVVHPGARTAWPGDPRLDSQRVTAAGVSEPFFLTVAASYPHKNLQRLVDALPAKGQHHTPQLVVVGLRGRSHPAIQLEAARHPDMIKLVGWVDDALLASLYRRSLALAFPSLYEGFGLPIIEAMALGTPVLTSNIGAMAEVAARAAELVDPYSVHSIRAGLQRLAADSSRRDELRQAGLIRAAHFSWDQSARQVLSAYAEAAADTGS